MPTPLSLIPPAARQLAAAALVMLVSGCAGDDLLLPRDGEPAELRRVSGDQQRATAGDPVEDPLIVEALDRVGRPVSGAVIVFEFVGAPSGAEVAPANAETDADGRASAEVKLGTPAGTQNVEASLDDPSRDLSVRFRLIALEPRGGGGGGGGDDGGDDGGDNGGDGDDGGGGDDGDDGDDGGARDGKGGKGKGKGKGH